MTQVSLFYRKLSHQELPPANPDMQKFSTGSQAVMAPGIVNHF